MKNWIYYFYRCKPKSPPATAMAKPTAPPPGGQKGTGGGSFKKMRSEINRGNHLSKNGQKDKAKEKRREQQKRF